MPSEIRAKSVCQVCQRPPINDRRWMSFTGVIRTRYTPPPNQHDNGRNNPEWRCFIKHSDFPAMFSGWSSMKNTRDLHTQGFLKKKGGMSSNKNKKTRTFDPGTCFFPKNPEKKHHYLCFPKTNITLGSCFRAQKVIIQSYPLVWG